MFSGKNNASLFFIHIPKTAGTSFRTALTKSVKGKALLDYGAHSKNTSSLVNKYIYGADPESRGAIADALAHKKFGLLSGHVGFAKYRGVVSIDRVATFLRHPEDQVLSHYQHHKTLLGYQGTLETFAADKRFSNIQTRYLSGCKIEALGFIGLTERYDESLVLFNAIFNLKVKNVLLNKTSTTIECSESEKTVIEVNNQKDLALYRLVESRFEQQQVCLKQGLPWTSGWVSCNTKEGIISAQVWQAGSLEPVDVDVHYGNGEPHRCTANQHSAVAVSMGAPNAGYVGVRHVIGKGMKVSSVVVANTGQILPLYYV